MLHDEVKRLADSNDVVGLRYVFVDALDADPTFEFYQEDYDYCRSKGLLEPHQELTPLTQDQTQWTKDYWAHLKVDLLKNLSEKRLMHMKQVAQVLKAVEQNPKAEKGEYCLVLAWAQEDIPAPEAAPSGLSLEARLFDGLVRGLSLRESMEEVTAQGERKNAVYAASLRVKQLMEGDD